MTPFDSLISIIVPTRNQHRLLERLLDSLVDALRGCMSHPEVEIIVVDNDSDDPGTIDFLDTLSTHELAQGVRSLRRIPYKAPFNFSAIVNHAVQASEGDLICLLNDDTEVRSADWLYQLAALAALPDAGCVGAQLHYTDGRIQHAGVVIGMDRVAGHAYRLTSEAESRRLPYFHRIREVSAVTGACLMVRRELFERVGGMDEALPSDFNDVDLCLRVREAGWQNLWTPHATLFHHESASRGRFSALTREQQEKRRAEGRYLRNKLGPLLGSDPHWQKRRGLLADASWPRQRRLLQSRFEHRGNRIDWESRIGHQSSIAA